ncbi:DUF6894 family protein [Methylobacterium indicum]|uniref:DUF6894 family protein n=1 Tax=Methylobacterium indicum TaxID=1775910 RepID=UPI00243583A5|nr:hypothetical protein [Methylobacterium indicum]
MGRYYFDIYDGQSLIRDDFGIECRDPDAIRAEAVTALPAIARDAIPKNGDWQAVTVIVRNASNLTVFTATLTLASIWLGEDVPPGADDTDQRGGCTASLGLMTTRTA